MKKYLLLLILLLVPTIAFANDTKLNVTIVDDDITVEELYVGEISDYSNYLTYSNRILTIKEGTAIANLESNNIDLTITSNNKPVSLGYIYRDWHDSSKDKTVTIKELINAENGPFNMSTSMQYSSIVVEDSVLYNFSSLYNQDSSLSGGITVKDSKIYGVDGSQIHPGGPIYLENVEYYGASLIHSEESSMTFIDSYIEVNGSMHCESGDGYIRVINSTIKGNTDLSAYPSRGYSNKYGMEIVDSNIEIGRLYIESTDKPSLFKNSSIKLAGGADSDFYSYLTIEDTTVTNGVLRLHRGGYFKNATINSDYGFGSVGDPDTLVEINDSKMNLKGYVSFHGPTILDNTWFSLLGYATSYYKPTIKNSYIKVINSDENKIAFQALNGLEVSNSYLYIENDPPYLIYPFMVQGDFIYNNEVFSDKNNVPIYAWDERNNIFFYDEEVGDKLTYSVTMSSKVNVTFKVKGGTWSDGTSDDIVVSKDIWSKLSNEDIPTGMLGDGEGYWEVIPSTDDYLKENLEFVYVFSKVKGVEENPKTGVFTYTSLILVLLMILLYIRYRYKHETLYKYN